jgi:hypothetical protein
MQIKDLMKQLSRRRVFRAAVIYAAFVWVALQAADVFAGEGIIPEQWVRWLILLAAIGFPLVLIGSWFLEGPWKERGRVATAGDFFVILAITAGAGLFAWQQWFSTTSQTTVTIGEIEATDLQSQTRYLADHLEERFAYLLQADAEADLRLEGTLSRGGDALRLTVRIVDRTGELLWSQTFSQALVDQAELQSEVIRSLVIEIPGLESRQDRALQLVSACPYPADADAIIAITDHREPELLATYIEENADNGLLSLQQSLGWYAASQAAPPPRRPVLHALAVQSLDRAEAACPDFPLIDELRVVYTQRRAP